MNGLPLDVITSNDISVAFLQADEFPEDDEYLPLADDLSETEKELLSTKKRRLEEVEKLLDGGREKINQVQNQRAALEALLDSNLLRRRVEIVALLANGGSEPFEEELRKVADQLKHVVEHIQVVEKRFHKSTTFTPSAPPSEPSTNLQFCTSVFENKRFS